MNKVLILMSVYNGEKYLVEQIESLIHQERVDVSILVRDDGSSDGTIDILENYKTKGILDFYTGENLRPARSFMHLLFNAPDCDYYAFCDQDDVWLPEKLLVATDALKDVNGPSMFYHAMDLVDEFLRKDGYYFRESEKAQSLQYSCLFGDEIAGCTMVFNRKLADAVRLYEPRYITMHDGWVHRVCLSVGGTIISDKTPFINYRQHGGNTVGMKSRSLKSRLVKFAKKEKRFSKLANEMLCGYKEFFDAEQKNFLTEISNYKHLSEKVKALNDSQNFIRSKKDFFELSIKFVFNEF